MGIRPPCGGRGLQTAAPRGRNTCAQSRGPAGSEPRTQRELAGNGAVPTPGALPGPGSPGLGGCPRRPPSFRTYVADASLRAMSGGTWRATESAIPGSLTVSGQNLRRTLPGGGRNMEEGMSSHPPGRLGGGAQSGAGSGTEGAGLGAGQGGALTAGPGRGVWGPPSRPPGGLRQALRLLRRECADAWVCKSKGGWLAGVGVSALATVQLPSTDGLARVEQRLCPWAPCDGPVCRQYTD